MQPSAKSSDKVLCLYKMDAKDSPMRKVSTETGFDKPSFTASLSSRQTGVVTVSYFCFFFLWRPLISACHRTHYWLERRFFFAKCHGSVHDTDELSIFNFCFYLISSRNVSSQCSVVKQQRIHAQIKTKKDNPDYRSTRTLLVFLSPLCNSEPFRPSSQTTASCVLSVSTFVPLKERHLRHLTHVGT